MIQRKPVRFYLEPDLRRSAEAGQHNFINKVVAVLAPTQHDIAFVDIAQRGVDGFKGHSLTHMKPPAGARGLTFRRVYHYPFWQIEASAERWRWDVAQNTYELATVPKDEAQRFAGFWKNRLFGEAPENHTEGKFIYVPLQGRLQERRSFQRCSPLQMIELCLAHDPARRVIAGLHPRETYSSTEITALERLEVKNPRFSVCMGQMADLLPHCDYVVSMNSAAAFAGYFFDKPVMLFAKIDFHHIAVNASPETAADAFAQVVRHHPDCARYLWWFWQNQSINAGRPEAEEKIAARLRRFGWLT